MDLVTGHPHPNGGPGMLAARGDASGFRALEQEHVAHATVAMLHCSGVFYKRYIDMIYPNRIHVWYIYQHLPYEITKCRYNTIRGMGIYV